jgi:ribosome biogenesis protein Tsr3
MLSYGVVDATVKKFIECQCKINLLANEQKQMLLVNMQAMSLSLREVETIIMQKLQKEANKRKVPLFLLLPLLLLLLLQLLPLFLFFLTCSLFSSSSSRDPFSFTSYTPLQSSRNGKPQRESRRDSVLQETSWERWESRLAHLQKEERESFPFIGESNNLCNK